MRFAWQGFELEVPETWGPVALQGKRAQGYVRLSSPSSISCQIRWQTEKKPDLQRSLETYFSRLRSDAKKAKQEFIEQIDEVDDRFLYRWKGLGQGRGVLMVAGDRVFFLEVAGDRKDSLKSHVNAVAEKFTVPEGILERWSVLGLDASLPRSLEVAKHQFLAGRTKLAFHAKGVVVEVERWGLATQLLTKHPLPAWTQNLWKMPPRAKLEVGDQTVRLDSESILRKRWALAKFQPELNQIQTLQVTSYRKSWRPEWDWLP